MRVPSQCIIHDEARVASWIEPHRMAATRRHHPYMFELITYAIVGNAPPFRT